MSNRFWFLGCVLCLGAIGAVAQSRDSYSYRVDVTSVAENEYEDRASGVTIITRNCGEIVDGAHARLMISATNITGWIAFDAGESCEVSGLIRSEDESASPDTDDSDGTDDATDEAIGMFA